jgi:hypothetical protein
VNNRGAIASADGKDNLSQQSRARASAQRHNPKILAARGLAATNCSHVVAARRCKPSAGGYVARLYGASGSAKRAGGGDSLNRATPWQPATVPEAARSAERPILQA